MEEQVLVIFKGKKKVKIGTRLGMFEFDEKGECLMSAEQADIFRVLEKEFQVADKQEPEPVKVEEKKVVEVKVEVAEVEEKEEVEPEATGDGDSLEASEPKKRGRKKKVDVENSGEQSPDEA